MLFRSCHPHNGITVCTSAPRPRCKQLQACRCREEDAARSSVREDCPYGHFHVTRAYNPAGGTMACGPPNKARRARSATLLPLIARRKTWARKQPSKHQTGRISFSIDRTMGRRWVRRRCAAHQRPRRPLLACPGADHDSVIPAAAAGGTPTPLILVLRRTLSSCRAGTRHNEPQDRKRRDQGHGKHRAAAAGSSFAGAADV